MQVERADIFSLPTIQRVEVPTSWPYTGCIIIKDRAGASSPNVTMTGVVDGSSAGVVMTEPNEAFTLWWDPLVSSWMRT